MSGTTRYLYDNFADPEQGAVMFTGAAAPVGYAVLTPAAGYVLANVLHHDPYTIVKLPGTNGLIDIDLGVARPVGGVGMFNLYLDSGASFPNINVWSSADNVAYHDHGRLFETLGWVGVRNRIFALPSIYERRYWRIQIATGTAWYLGRVFLGSFFAFDGIYSPGSTYQKSPPATRLTTASGLAVTHILGRTVERFSNRYEVVEDDFKAVVDAITTASKPFGYVHFDDVARHVQVDAGQVQVEHFWGPPNTWNISLPMESLP